MFVKGQWYPNTVWKTPLDKLVALTGEWSEVEGGTLRKSWKDGTLRAELRSFTVEGFPAIWAATVEQDSPMGVLVSVCHDFDPDPYVVLMRAMMNDLEDIRDYRRTILSLRRCA